MKRHRAFQETIVTAKEATYITYGKDGAFLQRTTKCTLLLVSCPEISNKRVRQIFSVFIIVYFYFQHGLVGE